MRKIVKIQSIIFIFICLTLISTKINSIQCVNYGYVNIYYENRKLVYLKLLEIDNLVAEYEPEDRYLRYFNQDGLEHGPNIMFYENGIPYSISNYRGGKQNGADLTFHFNGFLKQERYYLDNVEDSIFKQFDEKGILRVSGDYSNYPIADSLLELTTIKNEKLDNGLDAGILGYKKKHGKWQYFSNRGDLDSVVHYNMEEIVHVEK